ncbi:MAG TPA: glycoside hydrolase family 2 TIM barrel-domain containing protein [Terracidiphilus sp.]|nr:glycoside hydrolase family 2 TIM barrel-domain containing protein [Terracidiphilus sp.]
MFLPERGFQLWPAEPVLTPEQIRQLHIPTAGADWLRVHLPDDYIVKGEISESPNPALLVGGAVCEMGGRECVPPSEPNPQAGKKNPRSRRSAYGGHGYLPVYPAWYRREFTVPANADGKTVWLQFGGVYRDANVFVNGQFVTQHPSGYTTFRINITRDVRYGAKNEVAVFIDPRWWEGWWYEGGGIYRHVHLIIADKLHVAPWGTFIISKVHEPIRHDARTGDRAAADLAIQTTIRNDHADSRQFSLVSEIVDPQGDVVATTASSESLDAGKSGTFEQHVTLQDASLWSLAHRNLYRLVTTLQSHQALIDRKRTTFGIRALKFDPDKGFFLNGTHVEIKGIATHQDFPGIGIAAPDNLWSWRLDKLKAVGANAYRTSHNPLPEAFYQAADRMGILVMDETRHLGDAYGPKSPPGTPYSNLSEVKAMVLQHRNHPSIIFWSLANEEGLARTAEGAKIYAAMKAAVKAIDPTRPVTSAMNGGYTPEGFLSVEDLFGVNYHSNQLAELHQRYPHLMMFGSEDLDAKTSRGTLKSNPSTGRCSEYGCGLDVNGPQNGGEPWDSWQPVMENPFVAGEFVWTAFDYRGEPNPFSWPAVTSQTGMMDLAGFPKPLYYYWKAWWGDSPSVYVFPNWSLPKDMTGKTIVVRAFSNCEQVELLVNGKSQGKQPMPRGRYVDWQVPYAPGELTALGFDHGRVVARYTVHTAGTPAALRLAAEVSHVVANDEDVVPVAVRVVDAEGRTVPQADNLIHFTVSGAGAIAGVANGDPSSHESNVADQRRAFRGLAMVLVRAGNHPGIVTITAHSAGLKSTSIPIHTESVKGNQ